jgi:hypothetical protein
MVPINVVELECKNCGAPLDADNVSGQLSVARCPHCQAVFALETIAGPLAEPARPSLPVRVFSRPRHFRTELRAGQLVIEALPAIGTLWGVPVMLLFLMIPGFITFGFAATGAGIFTLFPLMFVFVFVGVFLKALDTGMSRIRITVDGMLCCWKRGLTTRTYCNIPVEAVTQLYVTEHVTYSDRSKTIWYNLYCVRDDGNRELIYDRFHKQGQALYIEQVIENHLGLDNVRVGDSREISR